MRHFDLFVFDLAGTTIADQEGLVPRIFLSVAAEHSISTDLAELNSLRGRSKADVLRLLIARQYPGADVEARVAAAHADFQDQILAAYRRECRPIAGAEATFRFLHAQGAKVAVNTGFDRTIVNELMAQLGWLSTGVVDLAVAVDEVAAGRPAPDMIQRAMALLGVTDAQRVVKVGDTPVDMQEGHSAGCGAIIGVCTGTTDAATLRAQGPTHVLASVADLPALATVEGWFDR